VQDYRPAYYGGISAVELSAAGATRVALAVSQAELSRRIVLAYTGASRNSGINNWDVMVRRINGDRQVIDAFEGIRDAAVGVRRALERADWRDVAAHISREWEHRKRLAPGVSTPAIEALLGRAWEAGALAGKVCGAGGGGCLVCLTDPDRQAAVAGALTQGGATVLPVSVEADGLRVERQQE
jgi:D-glycero-alpha-D-manno-heptose-7-phosphate kinase